MRGLRTFFAEGNCEELLLKDLELASGEEIAGLRLKELAGRM